MCRLQYIVILWLIFSNSIMLNFPAHFSNMEDAVRFKIIVCKRIIICSQNLKLPQFTGANRCVAMYSNAKNSLFTCLKKSVKRVCWKKRVRRVACINNGIERHVKYFISFSRDSQTTFCQPKNKTYKTCTHDSNRENFKNGTFFCCQLTFTTNE